MRMYLLCISDKGNDHVQHVLESYVGATNDKVQSACVYFDDKNDECTDWSVLDAVQQIQDNESLSDEFDLQRTAAALHRLTDTIPATDVLVDVCLWPTKRTTESGYILFLGALRRLKDWHNAKFTIFDPDPSEDTEFLQKFTSASVHVQTDSFSIDYHDLMWRGKVSICDKIENKGLTVPGVSLHKLSQSSPDLMFPLPTPHHLQQLERGRLGRMFEVMDEVLVSSIPAMFITPHTYKLCLYQKHPFSQILMNYIQQNDQAGFLARLAVYPDSKKPPVCSEVGLSAEAWKENISTDIQFVQEPEEDLQDNYEFLFFIITSPDQSLSPESFVAHANLLEHPYSLSGAIATSIFHQSLCAVKGEQSVNIDLSDLPLFNSHTLRHVEQDILYLQRIMLERLKDSREKAGQSLVLDHEELSSFLGEIRVKYLTELRQKLPPNDLPEPTVRVNLQKEVYEAGENSYEWRERLVQQYQESQRRTLSRIQSSESMQMSSPIQHGETSTSVDIQCFLKFFHPDGTAAADNLSPVRRRRGGSRVQTKLCTPDVGDNVVTTWPESKDTSSHDIYYNIDKKSEKVNNHLNKLQERYVKDETYSSCRSPIVLFPKVMKKKAIKDPAQALRRSPRKKAPPRSDQLNTSVEDHRKQRLSAGRLSEWRTPQGGVRDRENKRRYSTTALSQPVRSLSLTDQGSRRLSDIGEKKSTPVPRQVDKLRRDSDADSAFVTPQGQAMTKESRSDRHKRRLLDIVNNVLEENGVPPEDPIYKSCSSRLYKVTKLFVMDLPNSRNLKEEMINIAKSQVKQVIEVDRNRQKDV
ncbi:mdm2-binding protein-like [Mya arenaria]|uniref:mdm2-binding protein-like n=1 Tax=Mya arenaria TaxID=6604 RepID=UPI0022E37387|nr:mdm2-binding protein-like [Mya arenaria]